ncbi:MAG: hypothetical protein HOP12_03680, partial [Candidatus Eisenbacteria bacterium]|nr:hypothetical protein [Candidatus Eisenbacteria bacterium]
MARPAAASVFPALPAWVGWLALGTVLLVRCLTVGWVADDLVFMDAARRETFGELLSGRHGILGYYRPVSRELYFWLFGRLLGLGPFALHLVNALVFALMVGVFAATVRRLCGARSAWFAAALLILFPPTGALLSWISCAQDLIATLLVVLAMWWWVSGASPWWVAIACALAPLAKESAIVAPGLVLALELMWRRAGTLPERVQRVAPAFLGAAVAIAIQLAVRSGWPAGTAVAIWSPAQFANAWRLPIDFLVTWWPPHALAGIGAALRDSFALTAFVTVTAIAAAWAAERVLRGRVGGVTPC